MLTVGSANALTYTSGDLVTVFVNNGNEFIADLGNLATLASGTSVVLGTSASLGSTGGTGGIFTAFETNAPFTGNDPRSLTFTTDPSVNPPSNDNVLSYVRALPSGQLALDDGSASGWLFNLSGFPAAGTGGVLVNDATRVAIPTSNPSSYTNVIGLGTNELNNLLPFSTAATLSGNGQVVDLWTGKQTGLRTSVTTLIGTLTVDGNFAGDGSEVRVTFNAVPEPGTLLLVGAGLAGLVWSGRGRRAA